MKFYGELDAFIQALSRLNTCLGPQTNFKIVRCNTEVDGVGTLILAKGARGVKAYLTALLPCDNPFLNLFLETLEEHERHNYSGTSTCIALVTLILREVLTVIDTLRQGDDRAAVGTGGTNSSSSSLKLFNEALQVFENSFEKVLTSITCQPIRPFSSVSCNNTTAHSLSTSAYSSRKHARPTTIVDKSIDDDDVDWYFNPSPQDSLGDPSTLPSLDSSRTVTTTYESEKVNDDQPFTLVDDIICKGLEHSFAWDFYNPLSSNATNSTLSLPMQLASDALYASHIPTYNPKNVNENFKIADIRSQGGWKGCNDACCLREHINICQLDCCCSMDHRPKILPRSIFVRERQKFFVDTITCIMGTTVDAVARHRYSRTCVISLNVGESGSREGGEGQRKASECTSQVRVMYSYSHDWQGHLGSQQHLPQSNSSLSYSMSILKNLGVTLLLCPHSYVTQRLIDTCTASSIKIMALLPPTLKLAATLTGSTPVDDIMDLQMSSIGLQPVDVKVEIVRRMGRSSFGHATYDDDDNGDEEGEIEVGINEDIEDDDFENGHLREAFVTITPVNDHVEVSSNGTLCQHHPVSILLSSRTTFGGKVLKDRVYRCLSRLQNVISGHGIMPGGGVYEMLLCLELDWIIQASSTHTHVACNSDGGVEVGLSSRISMKNRCINIILNAIQRGLIGYILTVGMNNGKPYSDCLCQYNNSQKMLLDWLLEMNKDSTSSDSSTSLLKNSPSDIITKSARDVILNHSSYFTRPIQVEEGEEVSVGEGDGVRGAENGAGATRCNSNNIVLDCVGSKRAAFQSGLFFIKTCITMIALK